MNEMNDRSGAAQRLISPAEDHDGGNHRYGTALPRHTCSSVSLRI
jgi:hypothetical protein